MDKQFTMLVLIIVFSLELFTLMLSLFMTGKILYPALILTALSGIGLIICCRDNDDSEGYA